MKKTGVERRYSFESFRFDAGTGELCRSGTSRKLRPQAAVALELLVSRPGELVTRDELREALWPDERIVMFESSIAAVMRELRRALEDDPKSPRFIETIPKRGYRFVAREEGAADADSRTSRRRGIHATTGGFLNLSQGLAMALVVLLPGAVENMPPLVSARHAEPVTLAVLSFDQSTALPPRQALAEILPRDVIGWLGPAAPGSLRVLDGTGGRESGDAAPDFVLRGSVRDDGDAVFVSARLLSGADGAFVWGEDYRRPMQAAELAARELSARIAEGVLSSALPEGKTGDSAASANADAVEHYRRGRDALQRFDPEATAEAVDAFRQAVRLDPGFDAAHAHLAEALIHWVGPPLTAGRVEEARQAALRSISLQPRNAVGHRVLGEIRLFYDRDWPGAGSRLERSVELAPWAASGHHSFATWLSSRGRHDEALREIELAEALDPASVAVSIDVMLLHYFARDFEGTLAAARRLRQLWPDSHSSHRYSVLSRLAMGEIAAAAAEARAALAGTDPAALAETRAIPTLTDSEALQAYWKATLDAMTRHVQQRGADPGFLSLPQVQLGRPDAAVDALETSLREDRFSYLLPFLGVSPAYDSLCGHPRFERILRDLNQAALSSESVDSRCAAAMQAARLPARAAR